MLFGVQAARRFFAGSEAHTPSPVRLDGLTREVGRGLAEAGNFVTKVVGGRSPPLFVSEKYEQRRRFEAQFLKGSDRLDAEPRILLHRTISMSTVDPLATRTALYSPSARIVLGNTGRLAFSARRCRSATGRCCKPQG
jgi:hypothetical protein